eukprot:3404710-Rhodomonas_salina.1
MQCVFRPETLARVPVGHWLCFRGGSVFDRDEAGRVCVSQQSSQSFEDVCACLSFSGDSHFHGTLRATACHGRVYSTPPCCTSQPR